MTPEGQRQVDLAVARGWVRNFYAIREGVVACPRCSSLINPGAPRCHSCDWSDGSSAIGKITL